MSCNKQVAQEFLYASLAHLEKEIFESNARSLKAFGDTMKQLLEKLVDGQNRDVITPGLGSPIGGLHDTRDDSIRDHGSRGPWFSPEALHSSLPGIPSHNESLSKPIRPVDNHYDNSPKRLNKQEDESSGESLQYLKLKKQLPIETAPREQAGEQGCTSRQRRPSMKEEHSELHSGLFSALANFRSDVKQGVIDEHGKPGGMYRADHWATTIVTSQAFDYFTLLMIGINALWIAYDTDFNDQPLLALADVQFQVAEHIFCGFFTLELILRFSALDDKRHGWRERWFLFDSILVLFMISETWILSLMVVILGQSKITRINVGVLGLFRLLRLARLARMARLVREMPELMILVKGLLAALRSVCFTLCLLIIIMYCFAIAIVQLMTESDFKEEWFRNVPGAMVTLLLEGILTDQAPIVRESAGVAPYNGVIVLLFILLGSLTVMNMLMGVLVEVVSVVASAERDIMDVEYVTSKMFSILEERGDLGDAVKDAAGVGISRQIFIELMKDPKTRNVVEEVGVDHPALMACADFIFRGGESSISFTDFIEVILSFRGSQHATVKDIVDLKAHVLQEIQLKMQDLKAQLHHQPHVTYSPKQAFYDDGAGLRAIRCADDNTDGGRSPPHLPRFPPSMWHREDALS